MCYALNTASVILACCNTEPERGGFTPYQVAGLGKCSIMLITAKRQRKGQAQNTTGKGKEPIIGCDILGVGRSSQVGSEGISPVDQGWLPMQPSSLAVQLLHPEFRWVYMDPKYAPGE